MSWKRYAYGTIAAASAIGVGIVAIFYDPSPPKYLQAPTDVEIAEAILERTAAVADWPFTYSVTDVAGWDVTVPTGASYIPLAIRAEVTSYYEVATWEEGWIALTNDFGGDLTATYELLRSTFPGYTGTGPGSSTVDGQATNITSVTNWSFNPYPEAPLIGGGPSRDLRVRSMQQIEGLIPQYVKEVSNGVPIMWDVTNFWVAAGIGNGTAFYWTVSVTTNSISYGLATNLSYFGQTNVQWEMHRALALMTTTVRDVSSTWLTGTKYATPTTNAYWLVQALEKGPRDNFTWAKDGSEGEPPWWTGKCDYVWGVQTGGAFAPTFPATVAGNRLRYVPAGSASGVAYETVDMRGMSSFPFNRGTWIFDPNYYLYGGFYTIGSDWYGTLATALDGKESASYLDSTSGIYVANLATGVLVTISFPWSVTGRWARADSTEPLSTNLFRSGTSFCSLACSGVSTDLLWAAVTGVSARLDTFLTVSNEEASGVVSDVHEVDHKFVWYPPPALSGHCAVSNMPKAVLNWTFTRCTN